MANSSESALLLKKVPMEHENPILPLFIGTLIHLVRVYVCPFEKDFEFYG